MWRVMLALKKFFIKKEQLQKDTGLYNHCHFLEASSYSSSFAISHYKNKTPASFRFFRMFFLEHVVLYKHYIMQHTYTHSQGNSHGRNCRPPITIKQISYPNELFSAVTNRCNLKYSFRKRHRIHKNFSLFTQLPLEMSPFFDS